MGNLTAAKPKSLSKPGLHGVGDGLYLNVTRTGSRSWVQRISIDGRRRDIGLGAFPTVSLARARTLTGDLPPSTGPSRMSVHCGFAGQAGGSASASRWTAEAGAWTTFGRSLGPVAFAASVIERLWRSLKYEAVYLHEIADGPTARRVIGEWIGLYHAERPHTALGGRTPVQAYWDGPPVDTMDKPLRALTTYPQAQQQQQEDRFKGILAA